MLQDELHHPVPTAALPSPQAHGQVAPPHTSVTTIELSQSPVDKEEIILLRSPSRGISKNYLLGLLMKQQTLHKRKSDEAFERHQRRQAENPERFQKMILQHLKN